MLHSIAPRIARMPDGSTSVVPRQCRNSMPCPDIFGLPAFDSDSGAEIEILKAS
jgi:hypothetical protein